MTLALDRTAVLTGVLVCVAIVAPAVLVYGALEDGDASSWVFFPFLAIVAGYLVAGGVAGFGAPRTPFVNGAAATVLGFLLVQAGATIVTGEISVVGLVFNALLAASIGMIGAGWGARRAAAAGRMGDDGESSG